MANEQHLIENDFPQITVHLDYNYLSAQQLAELLDSIDAVYTTLTEILIYERFQYTSEANIVTYPIPLCVTYISTTHSIEFKVSFARQALPSVALKDGNLELTLPKWSAVIVLSGIMLQGSLSTYNQFLETIKTREEIHKIRLEIGDLERKLSEPSPEQKRLDAARNRFGSIVLAKNITKTTVNDVTIHDQDSSDSR